MHTVADTDIDSYRYRPQQMSISSKLVTEITEIE